MKKSLAKDIPAQLPEELIDVLCVGAGVRVERIVSRGHASPEGFWYDQEESEFVLLVQGRAGLRVEGQPGLVVLEAGDYLNLEPHVKHRVEWTDPDGETIWLAVHY